MLNLLLVLRTIFILKHCPIDQFKVLISAVQKKALKNLKFLHEKKRFPIDDNYHLFDAAACIENNIPMMEFLVSHNCPISRLTMSKVAAQNVALNNMKWLLKNGILMKD